MTRRIAKTELTELVRAHKFSELFTAFGWDEQKLHKPFSLSVDERQFSLRQVAEKRGFVICVCDAREDYPDKETRHKLLRKLGRQHYEHLLIMLGPNKQCWALTIRPQNRPLRFIEADWREDQDPQTLMEKMDGMLFDISEERDITITDVVDRVRGAFMQGAEKITKSFYERSRKELESFGGFISGIQDQVQREWYAVLMVNRLMFIYFIQKCRFLSGDPDYLKNRLDETKKTYGENQFHDSFYRHFLRRLFAEGFGTPPEERDPGLESLLGKIPYLNGGLFDLHSIEEQNHDIQIPDEAFENLFRFFDQYNWRLDSRSTASGSDINPDVLGYIFEKYINERAQMGAYYTQEDVTGYIARNTIIPFLLSRAKEQCANAFNANGIWRLLRENPDNYIYDAARKGCEFADDELPAKVRRGIDTAAPDLLARRRHWNEKADEKFALPTETWREVMARRGRYFALRAKMQNGEIQNVDDLITHNLDIQRFAQDALNYYEGADFIEAFFVAIAGRKAVYSNHKDKRGLTVLDPACGSGAFLFAALNVLEPLYRLCTERMEEFVQADDRRRKEDARKGGKKYPLFRETLDQISAHPNKAYWIYKTIILNNLYGVDLMREAAEVAKLRMFLKLAAEAEYKPGQENLGLEPLPDIDFNIRAGNSLVGFADMQGFEQFAGSELDLSGGLVKKARESAREVSLADKRFREAQGDNAKQYRQAKKELNSRLDLLNQDMNRYLAKQYGIDAATDEQQYNRWLDSCRPFHWLAEFYGIMEEGGGFDVVIGNPPYVEYGVVKKQYEIKEYKTESCGNIYAMFVERAMALKGSFGRAGMIVQLPIVCTDRMIPLQKLFADGTTSWFLNFDDRPGKLFADLSHIRATVFLTSFADAPALFSSNYKRWYSNARETIFQDVAIRQINENLMEGIFPKLGDSSGSLLFSKIKRHETLSASLRHSGTAHQCVYHNSPQYWIRSTDFVPYFWNERDGEKKSSQVKNLTFSNSAHALAVCALLNSSLFYWWFIACSDCRHLNMREIVNFPFNPQKVDKAILSELSSIVKDLMADYRRHAVRKETKYATTGKVVYDEFYPRHSKAIIDRIDTALAKHYGLTESELDYIINYDIKYRMGGAKDE